MTDYDLIDWLWGMYLRGVGEVHEVTRSSPKFSCKLFSLLLKNRFLEQGKLVTQERTRTHARTHTHLSLIHI